MSLIIYKDNVIYSDRSGIQNYPQNRFSEMKKLYVHKTKHYAFVVTGNELSFESDGFQIFAGWLEKELSDIENEHLDSKKFESVPLDHSNVFLILTKNNIYTLRMNDEQDLVDNELLKLNSAETHVTGSGCYVAHVFLELGKPIEDVFKLTAKYDSDMFETCVDNFAQKDLISFSDLENVIVQTKPKRTRRT